MYVLSDLSDYTSFYQNFNQTQYIGNVFVMISFLQET